MDFFDKALARSKGFSVDIESIATKSIGGAFGSASIGGAFGGGISQSQTRRKYSLLRGWVYSGINAIGAAGAKQPIMLADIGEEDYELERGTYNHFKAFRNWSVKSMTESAKHLTENRQYDLVDTHPYIRLMERPNKIQRRWQFVYSFIVNLVLTGWSYIVSDEEDGELVYYSLPSTWITPDHKEGLFSKFYLTNPKNPAARPEELDGDRVGFAMLPNPADPLGALSPAGAQMPSIRIDENIQLCQENFFHNGVFPSVLVKVGANPGPTGQSYRPRLSGPQRRQVYSAISKTMQGVFNYGNPAIVDGLIEGIERFSMSQNEIGWEKSEDTIRNRILSALGVHPFILGEPMNVGGYAQAAEIRSIFYERVNTYLDMLGTLMTEFALPRFEDNRNLITWWEPCKAEDPSMRWSNLNAARARDDVSEDEIRAELGFPPREDKDRRSPMLDAPAGIASYLQMAGQVNNGALTRDAAIEGLMLFFKVDKKTAEALIPDKPPTPALTATGKKPPKVSQSKPDVEEAAENLELAASVLDVTLKSDPKKIAHKLLESL